MACIPLCNEQHKGVYDGTDVLLLGLEGAGKTLVAKRLQSLYGKGHQASDKLSVETISTIGTETLEVTCAKGSPFRRLVVREVGGQMLPLWPQYYSECLMVVFVVDVACMWAVAPAAVELMELMQHPQMQNKPVCMLLNKYDLPVTLARAEVEMVMHMADLERCYEGRVSVVEMSAVDAGSRQDAEQLLAWMVGRKCMALGLPLPASKHDPAERKQTGLFDVRNTEERKYMLQR